MDFEFILPEDAARYPEFIATLRESLAPLGIPVMVALVPKTSADQKGTSTRATTTACWARRQTMYSS